MGIVWRTSVVKFRWPAGVLTVLGLRALRVRLSVGPRRKHWHSRSQSGDLLLVALGDSLTQGIGSSRPRTSWLGGFIAQLESTTGRAVRVDNRSVYGARIADVLSTQLPLPEASDLVTLCIGANDAGRTPPPEFRSALRRLCALLPAGSIVGDIPEFQWGPRVAAAAELAAIVREVVAECPDLKLAEVERFTAGTKILTELAGDFFHPGDRAYRRIAAAFAAAGSAAVGLDSVPGSRSLPADPIRRGATMPMTVPYRLVMIVVSPVVRWWGRLEVTGAQLLLTNGPVLVVVNHDSHWDPLVVGVAAARTRQIRAMAKSSLWNYRVLAAVLNGMGQLPITRGRADRAELQRVLAALNAGAAVGIFPEATISNGHYLRPYSGAGWLAKSEPAPALIAVAVTGAVDLARFPKRPRIQVRFFEPVGGPRRDGESSIGFSRRVTAEIRARAPYAASGRANAPVH